MAQLRMSLLASAAVLAVCFTGAGSQSIAQTSTSQAAPDNSAQNKRHSTTADSQNNASADRHTTAAIRKAIIADKSLSIYAHNVKIITKNGAVTLKGPVRSEEEKQKVASVAASVVSADKVTNQLTVKQ